MKKTIYHRAFGVCDIVDGARPESFGLSAPGSASGAFDVFVNVTGVFDSPRDSDVLLGYGFNVSFDSSILTYLGETPGALFDDLSGIPGAQLAGVASAILLGPGDFTEPLNLAILHFDVIGGGTPSIGISGDISDPNEGLIYLSGSDPISEATLVSAAPEPGSLRLLSGGLLAFFGARLVRQRRRAA